MKRCVSLDIFFVQYPIKMVKLVLFIIDSDTEPVYAYNRDVWKSYMHSDPDICSFFVRMDKSAPEAGELRGDTLFFKGQEGFIPAILDKTIAAFEYAQSHLQFDFLLRTNLSSFYIFPELKRLLETLPSANYYGGVIGQYGSIQYASGAGFMMSRDIVEKCINHKDLLARSTIDDVAIGQLLMNLGHVPSALSRFDFTQNTVPSSPLPQTTFHVRVKNPADRLAFDRACLQYLLKTYYGITLTF